MRAVVAPALFLLAACAAEPVPEPETGPPEPAPTSTPPAPVEEAPDEGIEVSGLLHPPMPTAVTSFGAARLGDDVYVLGGYHGEPHAYSKAGQSAALWRLSLDPGRWVELGALEAGGLQGLAMVAHGGRVCRVGGNRALNEKGEAAQLRSVEAAACFDPKGRSWTELPPLPAGRSSHDATVVGDSLVVVGGWQLGAEGHGGAKEGKWHDDALVLDMTADEPVWRTVEAPFRRRALGVASAGGRAVVVGGFTPERSLSKRVDVLDPESGRWERGPDFPADAFGIGVRGTGDAVYASGRDGVVYRWRLGKEAWERVTTLAFPRFFHRLVDTPEGDLIALGGISGMHTAGRTRHVERVKLDAEGATLAAFEMPYPGGAKNRQGAFVRHDFVYLFGGNDSLGQHDFGAEHFMSEGWRFHLPSLSWKKTAPYPRRRQTMQTLTAGGLGISAGGFGHDGEAAVTHDEAFAFDFDAESWSERGGLPRGRTQFGLAEHEGELWIFGGLNYDPAREGAAAFDHVTDVLVAPLEPTDAPFQDAGVELPGPRRAFAGAAHEGRYHIVGGMKEGFSLVDDCLSFDFAQRAFSPMPCPRRTRLSGHLVELEGKLYLVGGAFRGDDGMQSDRSIEVYDPETEQWSLVLEDVGFDTKHAQVFAYEKRLLLLSTHREEPRARIALIDPIP